MKVFIDIVMKRIYLFIIVAWSYRKKIGFPVYKKENFAGPQAHRKRGKSARASPTPHHTLNEERSARFTAQHLSALAESVCSGKLVRKYIQEFLKRHATNSKLEFHKSCFSKQVEYIFFILSIICFNQVVQPCLMHLWKHWLKIT